MAAKAALCYYLPVPKILSAASQRFAAVDILRGLSIIAVVLFHIAISLGTHGAFLSEVVRPSLFHLFFDNALDGVSVFFAVSGFLITLTCLRRFGSLHNISPRIFYRIRFARIGPLLLLVLCVLSLLHIERVIGFLIPEQVASLPRTVFAVLTFHLNWLEGTRGFLPAPWDVLWSLSVEEMFYIVFPIACLTLRWRVGRLLFGTLLLGLVIAGPFARTMWSVGRPIWSTRSYFGGMSSITMGCITAMLVVAYQRRRDTPRKGVLLAIAWGGVLLMALIMQPGSWAYCQPLWRTGTGTTVLILGVCAILFGTVLRDQPGRAWSAPVRWFGTHSYEIYLLHLFVIHALSSCSAHHTPERSHLLVLWTVVMLVLSGIAGWIGSKFFSEPMNRLLRGAAPPPTDSSQRLKRYAERKLHAA
jgi:peptidoglycan/LPS O-acetylase OafA/YrhL